MKPIFFNLLRSPQESINSLGRNRFLGSINICKYGIRTYAELCKLQRVHTFGLGRLSSPVEFVLLSWVLTSPNTIRRGTRYLLIFSATIHLFKLVKNCSLLAAVDRILLLLIGVGNKRLSHWKFMKYWLRLRNKNNNYILSIPCETHRIDRMLAFSPVIRIGTPISLIHRRVCTPPPPHRFRWGDTLACWIGYGMVPIRTRGQTLWYSRYIWTSWWNLI
jgi:hypothetical protein